MAEDGQTGAVRLASFTVSKLFGEFNHHIPLSATSHVTALIAPNGIGKTACLKLINALFRRRWSTFTTTDFQQICYVFSDNTKVIVHHSAAEDQGPDADLGLTIETIAEDGDEVWRPKFPDQSSPRVPRIDHFLPFLTRVGPSRWVHDYSGQNFSFQEVIENYSDQLPDSVINTINERPPPRLMRVIELIDCHLIETQRLLILGDDDAPHFRRAPSTLTISKKARTLREVIATELTAYAALSQSLDRSFPRRVIQETPVQPTDNLAAGLAELDRNRRKLMDAGILDTEEDEPLLPPGGVDQAVAAVLSVYVDDTKRKLDSLATILARITLFKELIDDRFKSKTIEVDKSAGFLVKRGADVAVPLEKLSSGEQHQLVLFFELLFELRGNALILIDEPELSLHVAWQKKFIPDLLRIIELNKFDVLLATHSPQLIGGWLDLVVELGDVEAA
ncbi:MAG: AAA family ATPase [Caulobacteraceae bacterium]